MTYYLRYSVEFNVTIECNETESLQDKISDIDIPENDSSYVTDSFTPLQVTDDNGNEIPLCTGEPL